MQDKKPRVNFNFDKIFNNQNIISLIEQKILSSIKSWNLNNYEESQCLINLLILDYSLKLY